ncbi:MAG TPA: adenylate/guanylate cyclase domain-containing protein [Pyrinomonadaceae bacterium]|nr:adenylate/guanylate cyclase domain-containing protein [Pyrinomonadaceae bacterium]
MKYILLAIALPSLVGGCLAWFLRGLMIPGLGDPSLLKYSAWWTLENTVPAIFPGVWLHRVFNQLYDPLVRMHEDRPDGWLFDILKYTAPWMVSILIAGCIVITIVSVQADQVDGTTRIWTFINKVVSESRLLVGLLVTFSVSILCALASAIGNTKRAWILYRAICRHSPTREAALRLVKAGRVDSKVRVLTVVFTDIRNFTQISNTLAPAQLLQWLNTYFDRMDKPRIEYQGAIDKFIGDGVMLVFGLEDEKTNGAKEAILYALSMLDALKNLNEEFRQKCFPEIRVGVGIHTGPVIIGEIGSLNRVQDSVIGDTVNLASRIEQKTKTLSQEALPVFLTRDTLQASGLLRDTNLDCCFVQVQSDLRGFTSQVCLYVPKDAVLIRERIKQLTEDPRGQLIEEPM